MLEKIGLPPKPSMRGNIWVIDASHCQGCASQFSFLNRKHHCRRCGGIFCNSCTQQRMVLRGQGNAPVRICEPCKKLEDAARFELRHGRKSRGSSKLPSIENALKNCPNRQEELNSYPYVPEEALNQEPERTHLPDGGSTNPAGLRQQAMEEKEKSRVLKREGKREEALQVFKKSKELERQALALEIAFKKSSRNALASSSCTSVWTHGISNGPNKSGQKNKGLLQGSKRGEDLVDELRELGWADADLVDTDKKQGKMSLDGEFSNLIREIPQKSFSASRTRVIDKAEVLAYKKNAVVLKREGKLAEAKEELKKAKLLEKKIEEQEFLADAEESDEDLAALITSINEGKDTHDIFFMENRNDLSLDLNHVMAVTTDVSFEDKMDVTDDDLNDPEILSALKSFGWNEESDHCKESGSFQCDTRALKQDTLNQKHAGDIEKMEQQRMENLLNFEELDTAILPDDFREKNLPHTMKKLLPSTLPTEDMVPRAHLKSKMMIQRELIALKKKVLILNREGKSDEAEIELKKGEVLEHQLEEMEAASRMSLNAKRSQLKSKCEKLDVDLDTESEEKKDVTDQDMQDPELLSQLDDLGWNDAEAGSLPSMVGRHVDRPVAQITSELRGRTSRSKGEIQKELLGIKRKALALRREGKYEEAEIELRKSQLLEAQVGKGELGELNNKEACSQEDLAVMMRDTAATSKSCGLSGYAIDHSGGTSLLNSELGVDVGQHHMKLDLSCHSVKAANSSDVTSFRKTVDLTGHDEWASHLLVEKAVNDEVSNPSFITASDTHTETNMWNDPYCRSCDNALEREEVEPFVKDIQICQEVSSQMDCSYLRQDILFDKRKALTLKREGKLMEAREELKQAKFLEKMMSSDNSNITISSGKAMLTSVSGGDSVLLESQRGPDLRKGSGRDRLKLQQQCLVHKRQALKLRREGKLAEAEAQSKLARAFETQIEELGICDRCSMTEPHDDVAQASS